MTLPVRRPVRMPEDLKRGYPGQAIVHAVLATAKAAASDVHTAPAKMARALWPFDTITPRLLATTRAAKEDARASAV